MMYPAVLADYPVCRLFGFHFHGSWTDALNLMLLGTLQWIVVGFALSPVIRRLAPTSRS